MNTDFFIRFGGPHPGAARTPLSLQRRGVGGEDECPPAPFVDGGIPSKDGDSHAVQCSRRAPHVFGAYSLSPSETSSAQEDQQHENKPDEANHRQGAYRHPESSVP